MSEFSSLLVNNGIEQNVAAVSCSAGGPRLGGVGIGVLVDGQAGLCMGRCMGGGGGSVGLAHSGHV